MNYIITIYPEHVNRDWFYRCDNLTHDVVHSQTKMPVVLSWNLSRGIKTKG